MPTTQLREIDNPDNEHVDDVDWEERVSTILGERALTTVWDEKHRADEASWRQIPGEQIDAALESAEIIKDNLRVAVRVTKEVACKLLGEGRFLTAHHSGQRTGTEKGDSYALSTYLAHRDRKEKEIGIAPKEGEPKIIYGYLEDITTQEYKDRARPYGQVSFVLKPGVIKRTTFTHGDSLQRSIMHAARLIGFDEAARQFELDNTSNTLKGRRRNYIEAQIQGGLTLDDIESITYRADQWDKESIVNFLASVEQAKPGLPVTVIYPASGHFYKDFIRIARENPHVTIIGLVETSSADTYGSFFSPFEALHRSKSIQTESRDAWQKARAQQKKLLDAIEKYSQEHYSEPTPSNIKVEVAATTWN